MTNLILALVLTAPASAPEPLKCAVMGNPVSATSPTVMVSGAKFAFCCGGCDGQFKGDPGKFMAAAVKGGTTIGEFLFDPVSHKRLAMDKAVVTTDYKGLRYPFESEKNLAAFKAAPAKFATVPAKEVLYCVVAKEKIDTFADSAGYVDHKGVRYFMCCPDCLATFPKNPDAYIANGTPTVAPLATKKQ